MGRIILITGATGHLGRNIVYNFLDADEKICIFSMPNDPFQEFHHINAQNVSIVHGDITSKEDVEKFLSEGDKYDEVVLIHAAGIVSIKGGFDQKVYNINVNGTKNIVDGAVKHHVKKLIYVSSVHAFTVNDKHSDIHEGSLIDPSQSMGLYAKTKSEATLYVRNQCQKNNIDYNIVFPSGLIGPNDKYGGHINTVIRDYLSGNLTSIVKGGYDMSDVRDVARTIFYLANNPSPSKEYILSNRFISIKELIDICSQKVNRKTIKHCLPIWFVKSVAPLAELYAKIRKERPIFTVYSMHALSEKVKYSHKKATEEINYQPTDLKVTLGDTVDYLLNSGVKLKKK